MGEVYRARDTRLGRDVAIKVLPAAFAADADRLRASSRKRAPPAALNHPNILAVYDVGTNRRRRRTSSRSCSKARRCATRSAHGGLPAAQGHRLRDPDRPRPCRRAREGHRPSRSEAREHLRHARRPRQDSRLRPGQADAAGSTRAAGDQTCRRRRRPKRSRAWCSGRSATWRRSRCAGSRPIIAPTSSRSARCSTRCCRASARSSGETQRRHDDGDPQGRSAGSAARRAAHSARARAHRRSLPREEPGRALSDSRRSGVCARVAVVAFGPHADCSCNGSGTFARPTRPDRVATAATLGVGLLAAGVVAVRHLREVPPAAHPVQFQIASPDNTVFVPSPQPAISPDGRQIAFIASKGVPMLWVRALASLDARPLPGTEGAAFPFWSPDSRSIGFFAAAKLKKIQVSGGPSIVLSDAENGRGGTWNSNNTIVFAAAPNGPLQKISSAGGTSAPVTVLDKDKTETAHRWPWFLPDGRHFVYLTVSGVGTVSGSLRVGSLESNETTSLGPAGSNAAYGSGHLVFVRGESDGPAVRRRAPSANRRGVADGRTTDARSKQSPRAVFGVRHRRLELRPRRYSHVTADMVRSNRKAVG